MKRDGKREEEDKKNRDVAFGKFGRTRMMRKKSADVTAACFQSPFSGTCTQRSRFRAAKMRSLRLCTYEPGKGGKKNYFFEVS